MLVLLVFDIDSVVVRWLINIKYSALTNAGKTPAYVVASAGAYFDWIQ